MTVAFLPLIVALPRVAYDLEWRPGFADFIGPIAHRRRVTYAVLDGPRIVGVLVTRFDGPTRTLHAYGTLVLESHRRRRLGEQLWRHAIRATRPSSVAVAVVTDKGRTLIESVMAQHPRIAWTVLQSGDRALRNLKKGRAS